MSRDRRDRISPVSGLGARCPDCPADRGDVPTRASAAQEPCGATERKRLQIGVFPRRQRSPSSLQTRVVGVVRPGPLQPHSVCPGRTEGKMATPAPATSPAGHPLTGRYLAILGAALLAIVGLVALLLIERQPIFLRVPMRDAALASDALAAADVADRHGQAMVAFGERLTAYANTPEGQLPEVQAITAQGEHWRVDGQNMIRVAQDVRRALATNPPGGGSV